MGYRQPVAQTMFYRQLTLYLRASRKRRPRWSNHRILETSWPHQAGEQLQSPDREAARAMSSLLDMGCMWGVQSRPAMERSTVVGAVTGTVDDIRTSYGTFLEKYSVSG